MPFTSEATLKLGSFGWKRMRGADAVAPKYPSGTNDFLPRTHITTDCMWKLGVGATLTQRMPINCIKCPSSLSLLDEEELTLGQEIRSALFDYFRHRRRWNNYLSDRDTQETKMFECKQLSQILCRHVALTFTSRCAESPTAMRIHRTFHLS